MKATIVMTKDAIKKGEYKETSLDVQKKQADMLVVAIDDKYTLWLNRQAGRKPCINDIKYEGYRSKRRTYHRPNRRNIETVAS